MPRHASQEKGAKSVGEPVQVGMDFIRTVEPAPKKEAGAVEVLRPGLFHGANPGDRFPIVGKDGSAIFIKNGETVVAISANLEGELFKLV